MDKRKMVLYERKEDCCGCEACRSACPRGAIVMSEDEYGFRYPEIREDACIRCGKCKEACDFLSDPFPEISGKHRNVWAAVATDTELRSRSSSGGIFAALARVIFRQGGVVFGASFDENHSVIHRMAGCEEELSLLQGSKYVQSHTGDAFCETKRLLAQEIPVLYSGTPCQIAGLKAFLGREDRNLYTLDIVCHGVPSAQMFRGYLAELEKKSGGNLRTFVFRDKKHGWGIHGRAIFTDKDKKPFEKILWQSEDVYLHHFTAGDMYRESCYRCPYTTRCRPGDLTIGDFWGIEKEHPGYLDQGIWDEQRGISFIMTNTVRGERLLAAAGEEIDLKESSYEKVSRHNAQLCHPCQSDGAARFRLEYREGGWELLEQSFERRNRLRRYIGRWKRKLPSSWRRSLKKIFVR